MTRRLIDVLRWMPLAYIVYLYSGVLRGLVGC